ncbi:SdrD B-like domain-containing protein [Staphylococcus pettenkoferi]|nr:SdrD B-like domain-containing protein [Staphylococcus pettenkoferi]MCY1567243.1 carboxypeptidase regulatory-like domain-containing protein [Staphylococcus pettenkoferi]MCY1588413.1 carboxypeptidase regulatory-like domain-containing protein [Staphylococcus pettenkoferi]
MDSGFHKKVETPEKPESTYELGDYVWEDTNKDGIQNKEEKGIEGVTVILKDENGAEISRTTTDQDGKYKFTGLKNGKYTVEFVAPEGYVPTKENVGNDSLDSDGSSVEVTINNANDYTIDSGFYKEIDDADADADADSDADADADADADSDADADHGTEHDPNSDEDHDGHTQDGNHDGNTKDHGSDKGHDKALPDTGSDNANTTLIGTVLAGLGSLLFFRRRKDSKEEK